LQSLVREVEPASADEDATHLEPLFSALDQGEEAFVVTAFSQLGFGGVAGTSASADLARHPLALARRPDFPLGGGSRDRHPRLAPALLHAIADAADPDEAAKVSQKHAAEDKGDGADNASGAKKGKGKGKSADLAPVKAAKKDEAKATTKAAEKTAAKTKQASLFGGDELPPPPGKSGSKKNTPKAQPRRASRKGSR
jgi:hypothetical protein